jgi:hypothetical protein
MAPSVVVFLPAIVFTATVASAQITASTHQHVATWDEHALEQFTTAVNDYLQLHRLLANPLPDLTYGADPEQAARARRAHRSLIREARARTERPRIFTQFVSAYLQEQIRWAVRSFPADREDWPLAAVVDRLPELPIELEYRFDGRDLVLLDVEADMVVDVLEDALPSSALEDSRPDADETCAPEPPPLVEGSPGDAHAELEMCWS